MRVAPLFPAAAGLIAGIALADRWTVPRLVLLAIPASACALMTILAVRRRHVATCVALAAFATGALWYRARVQERPGSALEAIATEDGRIVRVTGMVTAPPQRLPEPDHPFAPWTRRTRRVAFLMDVETAEGVKAESAVAVPGRIRVIVDDSSAEVEENDRVEVFGRLFSLAGPRNPGSFDWAEFQRKQGVVATLRTEGRRNVRRLERRASGWIRTGLSALQGRVRGWLTDDRAFGAPEEASLLEALVLGHRATLDRKLNEAFVRSGCSHFLAASGTNVAVLCSFVWAVARLLRLSNRGMVWLMVAAILGYALVADPRPPILRATVMGLFLCAAYLVGRLPVHINSLSAAAVVLLLWDPAMLFDAGFQLSFAAVLGVVYLAPALIRGIQAAQEWMERTVLRRPFAGEDRRLIRQLRCDPLAPHQGTWRMVYRSRHGLILALAVSVAAWMATLPIGMHYFERFQAWGPISTLLVFPLVCVSTWMGFAKTLLGAVLPTAGSLLAEPLHRTESLLRVCVDRLAELPGASMPVGAPPWILTVVYSAAVVMFAVRFRSDSTLFGDPSEHAELKAWQWGRSPVPKWMSPALGLTWFATLLGTAVWAWPKGAPHELRVTVLSVGNGLATVIELPYGGAVLYDAGSASPYDVGRNDVVPFLHHRAIRRVDRVFLSHADVHHFNGLPSVLDEISTGPVLVHSLFDPQRENRPANHLRRLLEERRRPLEILDGQRREWEMGGAQIEWLWPPAAPEAPLSANDSSTVLRISFAGRSILLSGDIGEAAQRSLSRREDVRADVMVLPGQSAVRGTLRELVAAIQPGVLIRSGSALTRPADRDASDPISNIPIYNTADVGAVEVRIRSADVTVTTPCRKNVRNSTSE